MDLTDPTEPKFTIQGVYAIFEQVAVTAVVPSSAYAFLDCGAASARHRFQQVLTISSPVRRGVVHRVGRRDRRRGGERSTRTPGTS